MGDVGEVFRVMGDGSVLGAERLGHVEAVKPHLIGIALLVPVTAGDVAWLLSKLIVKKFSGGEIALVARDAIQQEKLAAEKNVIELMFFRFQSGDGAIGGDERVDRLLDVIEVAGIGGVEVDGVHPFE